MVAYTVVFYTDGQVCHMRTYAINPDKAVVNAIQEYSTHNGEDGPIKMICCMEGHNVLSMLEHSDRWTWL